MAAVPDMTVKAKVTIESNNLTDEQLARGEALLMAREILRNGPVFKTEPLEVEALTSIAVFILDGAELVIVLDDHQE